jgi:hypothetical protein
VVTGGDAYGAPFMRDAAPDTGAPDVLTGADAYGIAYLPDAGDTGAPDVLTGGDAYGAPETGAPDAAPDAIEDGAAAD